ncbi:MAG: hypothetical protein Q9M43_07510 [Sulfurimonas sp.]|nr:hypothetical protein [Sulfurimonas sp.]
MKKYLLIFLITFHLMGSSLYGTKTFLIKDTIHQHHHTHNGSHHQHKHSHSQTNMNFVDFFTDTDNKDTLYFSNTTQVYLETTVWMPNPTLESLFRPPKI